LKKAAHGYAEFLTSSVMDTLETKVFLWLNSDNKPRRRNQYHW
jgi:adenylate kinase